VIGIGLRLRTSFLKDSRGSRTVSTATPSTYYAKGRSVASGRCQWISHDDSSDGVRAVSTKPASNEREKVVVARCITSATSC